MANGVLAVLMACRMLLTPSGQAVPDDNLRFQMEQALIQMLYPNVYTALQQAYQEQYPSFDNARIVRIRSYNTGIQQDRATSAIGGARSFEIDVEVRMRNYKQLVRIRMNNEEGDRYAVVGLAIEPIR